MGFLAAQNTRFSKRAKRRVFGTVKIPVVRILPPLVDSRFCAQSLTGNNIIITRGFMRDGPLFQTIPGRPGPTKRANSCLGFILFSLVFWR